MPEALHEALGQILAEERRQWRRERALIEAEAQRVIADLRATIAELSNKIRQKASEAKPDLSPDALREALGQMLAEERRQWQGERELLQSEAAKTLAEFRAQTVEWHNEFTSILNTRHRQFADTIDMRLDEVDRKVGPAGPQGPPGKLPPVKKFEGGKVYYEGDCVACDGGLYRQSGWEAVLPHVAMFPIELLLPHLFCSLARGAKEAGRITGRDCERAPLSRSVRDRALAEPKRPVVGRGQGRKPPEAVAHRASLEHGRSPVYFTPLFLRSAAVGFPVM